MTLARAVKCWSNNALGELGDETTTDSAVPIGVVGLGSGVLSASAGGFYSCAVTAAGALTRRGHNPNGELRVSPAMRDGNSTTCGVGDMGSTPCFPTRWRAHERALDCVSRARSPGVLGYVHGLGTRPTRCLPKVLVKP